MNLATLRGPSALLTAALLVAACEGEPLDPMASGEGIAITAARSAAQLDAPSNASASASSTSQIDLVWQDNSSNETHIEVHRSTSGAAGAFFLLTTLGVNATSHSDSGLPSATQYCYKLRSARSTGKQASYSQFSNTACATTQGPPPPPPPPAPAAPTVVNATPYNSNSATVDFVDNSTNEDGFRVYRSFDGAATWTVWATTSRDAVDVSDQSLQSEQNVCYRLTAFNAGGESAPSNHACTTPPASPSYVTAQLVDAFTFELTWRDNSAVEDGYEVRYTHRVNADGYSCGGDPMNADCYIYEEVVAVLGPGSTSYRFTGYANTAEPSRYLVYASSDGGFSYGSAASYDNQ